MTVVKGIFRPGETSYAVYKALLPNGDTDCAGAFSEEEYRQHLAIFYGKRVAKVAIVKKLAETDIGDGWREVNGT